MTAQAFSTPSHPTTIARRPAFDVLLERAATSMLAWSDRRAQKHQLTHERMALILENQRGVSQRGVSGSPLGR